jgi:hypothetical protein
MCQELIAITGHQDCIRVTHTTHARQINTGLYANQHVFLEHVFASIRYLWALMISQAEAMAGSMQEIIAVPFLSEEFIGGCIHFSTTYARTYKGKGVTSRLLHGGEGFLHCGNWRSKKVSTFTLRRVSVDA